MAVDAVCIELNVGALKNFSLAPERRVRLQFHVEFFNVLNHTNFNNLNATAKNTNFGRILSAGPAHRSTRAEAHLVNSILRGEGMGPLEYSQGFC